jgi:2,4-dienoyl-CoA reductase-like NADH-dependent reductase (Old Yellow Enzyme family)/thioredoxin reductase
MKLENLFSPCRIGTIKIKNRVSMPPMQTSYADHEGFITDRQIDYYVERAKGGVGLIIFEHTGILKQGSASINMTLICNDGYIPGFKKLISAIHQEGVKIAVQLNHAGRQTFSEITGTSPVAASPIPYLGQKVIPRELSIEEIHGIADAFAEATARVKKAGADVVEIHMAHGYLISGFLSPFSNKREDEYGGNIQGRSKFAVEVLRAVREKVGQDFPVICRLSGDEYVEGGLRLEDTKKIAQILENEGADALDISAALGGDPLNQPTYYFDEGVNVHLAEGVKSVVRIPVITVGRIRNAVFAEKVIQEKRADMVNMGRALIADPYLPKKAMNGSLEDIIPCISCNRCHQSLKTGPLTCTVNPETGREKELKFRPVAKAKRVLIVGGGLAGMKAAQIAALRGHKVTLYERSDKLGGKMRIASVPPRKEVLLDIVDYLERQLNKLPVTLKMKEQFLAGMIEEINPDVIIIATGAQSYFPDIKGIKESGVLTIEEVLLEKVDVGNKVVVVGGGGNGAEIADYLSEKGKQVIIIEMKEGIALDLPDQLQYHLKLRLSQKNVKILASTKVVGFQPGSITVEDAQGIRSLEGFDSIVIALGGAISGDEITKELRRENLQLYTIGDAKEPREAREALYEGEAVALKI